jgi:pSer/pThr/pTyr-binding forkhead associated (FHA) protein
VGVEGELWATDEAEIGLFGNANLLDFDSQTIEHIPRHDDDAIVVPVHQVAGHNAL